MQLILFGAGHYGKNAISFFGEENVFCFCDNAVKGSDVKEVCGKQVISFDRFMEIWREYITVVCLKPEFSLAVCRQLEDAGIGDYVVFDALQNQTKTADEWMEQLQDSKERGRIQRRFQLHLLDKVMSQFQYLRRHIDITTLTPATGDLRKRQFELLDEVEAFFDFIKELQIKPFLTFGNLIGAVRHQGFVPWDDDLDFGLIRSEYERLLEFARKKCVVLAYEPDDKVWVDLDGNIIENSELCKRYPGKYIFSHRPDLIQISKCTEETHYYVVDIWVYDFYRNEYDIDDYIKWNKEVYEEEQQKKTWREKLNVRRQALKNNPMISEEMTDHFFPGIDNHMGWPGERAIDGWIPSKEIFPLQKVKYEDRLFWAPYKMETLLRYEYIDYMKLPDDVGLVPHVGTEEDY